MWASTRTAQSSFSTGRFEELLASPMAGFVMQATVFIALTLVSLVQFCRQRAWFFWAFTSAVALQAGGCVAQAYVLQDETDHLSYLVAFSCLTLAPALLALSTIAAYRQLHSSTLLAPNKTGYRRLWIPEGIIGPFCTAIQTSAIAFFLLGIAALAALHSSTPIDGKEGALARLTYEAQALAFLRIGWMIQYIGLAVFFVVASGSTWQDYYLDGQARSLYWAINWATLLNCARTLWKLFDFMQLEPESLNLAADFNIEQWLIEILPLLAAFTLFIKHYPGKMHKAPSASLGQGSNDRKQPPLLYESPNSC